MLVEEISLWISKDMQKLKPQKNSNTAIAEKLSVSRLRLKPENGLNVVIWKSAPALINAPFEWAPLFTAEKFDDRPGLNEYPPQTRKGALIWKYAMSAEALTQIVCKNDKARVLFSQIFFVFCNKEIYKHIL